MQKFVHRILTYGIIGTQEPVLVRQGKRAIRVRASEVLLYITLQNFKSASRTPARESDCGVF